MQQSRSAAPVVPTMTSLELVDFINCQRQSGEPELRHDHFLAKVPKVLGEEGIPKFRDTYIHPQNGQTYQCYRFPKREACLMAMSFSYELQSMVYDRMTDLEQKTLTTLPNFADAVSAARAWADAKEAEVKAIAILEIVAPKAEFFDRVVSSRTGSMTIREVSKALAANERRFVEYLVHKKILYRASSSLMPYTKHLKEGRFRLKVGCAKHNGHAFTQTEFTSKGLVWITELWTQHEANKQASEIKAVCHG